MNVVANNIPGMFTSRQIGITNKSKAKSTEKLSSGYKINRAADDAAGLTISENMRRMIRGLTQASLNTEDGVSLCQVADGYLNEVHDMLHRITELAVKGANGTLTDDDRQAIDEEVGQLKSEMKRIFNVANFNEIPLFHVPYTPEIETIPTDMEVFHVGSGNVGGLEFNNVRYNISELQALGIPIDDNGVATDDLEQGDNVFTLWDGEEVDLSIKKGQTIDQAVRNYKWTAEDDGIHINGKLSAEWGEVRYTGNGLVDKKLSETDMLSSGVFDTGTYRFTHHGMTISFEVDEEGALEDLMSGINGDEATRPATWDVSVGGSVSKEAVKMDSGIQSINVTNANADFINHRFAVVADANGIAIKDRTANYTGPYKAWADFYDRYAAKKDENGNDVATNNGYPIINWGTANDANGESEITFDDSARYTYTATDSNVPKFSFAFKLAESASLDEVAGAMSRDFSTSRVYARGDLRASGTGTMGSLRVIDSEVSLIKDLDSVNPTGNFELQRAYGRDFDDPTQNLTADITVTRTVVGRNLADDVPDSSGGYSVDGHTVSNPGYYKNDLKTTSSPYSESTVYYKVGDDYYEVRSYYEDRDYDRAYAKTDRWSQAVSYTFDGSLNGTSMDQVSASQTENFERTLNLTRTETETWYIRENARRVSESDLTDEQKASAVTRDNPYVPEMTAGSELRNTSIGTDSAVTVGTAEVKSVNNSNYDVDFNSSKGKAFAFNYMVNASQANELAKNTGISQNVGTITFSPSGYAYRSFILNTYGNVNEAEFSNIKLNVPKKQLDIQSSADAVHYITMEWSPLNLTIIGLAGANTKTQGSSLASIGMVENALGVISETRSLFGAYQNRFEHTIRNLDNVVENTQAAESRIRDTDMAKEMVKYAKENILEQAGTAMLVQSNQSKNWIMNLLNS